MKAGNLLNIYDGKSLETLKIITSIEQIDNLAQGTVCFYVGDNIEIEISDRGNVCAGDFFKIKQSNIIIINRSINQVVLPSSSSSEEETPLTFTAETTNSSVTLNKEGSPNVDGLQYRYGTSGEWSTYTCGTTLTLENIGDCVQFKNTEETLSTAYDSYVYFSMSGKIAASGNTQSMLNYSNSCRTYCYHRMFYYCTSLTTAPELPATTLAQYCYESMFQGCKSLTTAPELPATKLVNYCYESMFRYCTSLTKAPELLATTLAEKCYEYMFYGCTGLTLAPELPATKLAENCYHRMFNGCTKLNYISVKFTEWNPSNATTNWVNGVASTGIFICPEALDTTQLGASYIPEGWIVSSSLSSLTLIAKEANSSITLNKTGSPTVDGLQYRYGSSGNWQTYTCGNTLTLENVGDCVQFQNTEETLSTSEDDYVYFSMSGKISALGNIQSMLNYSESCSDCCYRYMFRDCTSLTSAPELPATTLADYCYYSMFEGCTGLTSAPELLATTLANYCYESMFQGCTSLTTAPELPATTLAEECYYGMFYNCTNLKKIKVYFTAYNDSALTNWVYNVSSSGTFYKPSALPEEYGVNRIPTGWTVNEVKPLTLIAEKANSSITLNKTGSPTVDGLQYRHGSSGNWQTYTCGTTLTLENIGDCVQFRNTNETLSTLYNDYVKFSMSGKIAASGNIQSMLNYSESCSDYCYYSTFKDCTSLTTAPSILPATTLAWVCYESMFQGCTSLTTAPELPVTTLAYRCYKSMFKGCTSLTTAPSILPATTLAGVCYESMFQGCTSLTTAPELPATTLAQYCYNAMFNGCASLTSAPELPATTLADYCYQYMFQNCRSLTSAPELPATNLTEYCYRGMFDGCKSLTSAPSILPATTLAQVCYHSMFQGCTSLTTAPELPATTLVDSCYNGMFYGCTSLTSAPELPATKLAYSCYSSMFRGCTGLTTAPELPATELASNCYSHMFYGCTSLTQAPELPATELAYCCYEYMFKGCTRLNYISVWFSDWDYIRGFDTKDWCSGVSSTGTFKKPAELEEIFGDSDIPEGWTVVNFTPLTLIAETTNSSVTLNKTGYPTVDGLQYRYGTLGEWSTYTCGNTLTLENVGDKVQFQNTNKTLSTSADDYVQFSMSGKIAATDNIQSMLNYSDSCSNYCYYRMFRDCTSLTTAPKLSATTLANWCYQYMFYGCTSLTSAPELPATTLAYRCYYSMFEGCTSLTKAPELPATTLASYCYKNMFYGCTSLTSAPELPATRLLHCCYSFMFRGCTSLTSAPELPATRLTDWCYEYMFYGCTGLTSAPELPATKLADACYQCMFNGCTGLTQAPELPATTLADACYNVMFSGCTSLTSAPELSATTLARSCYGAMFSGCTRLTSAPELPATTLADSCYANMFSGCTGLTSAPELSATTLADYCYSFMFRRCTSLTTAPDLPATTLAEQCYYNMFDGCTKLNYIKVGFTEWNPSNATTDWVNGVTSNGTFICPPTLDTTQIGTSYIPNGWTIHTVSDGYLWSWGGNHYGQLGLGDSGDDTNRNTPTKVGDKKWQLVAAGGASFAIDTDGYLWSWGGNPHGQLGLGDSGYVTNRNTPTQVGTKTWHSVAAGYSHTLAIDSDGYLWSCGYNAYGQLGLGDSGYVTNRNTPTKVGDKKWQLVAVGGFHTLAIDSDGYLWGWGRNIHGQLGLGDTVDRTIPTQVGDKKWQSVEARGEHYSLAIDTDGYLWSWGGNHYGQLGLGDSGDDTNRYIPTQVGTKTWQSVAVGNCHSLAIDTDGYLWGWGDNKYGQLGLGDTVNRTIPTQVGDKKWQSVAGGNQHSIAINSDGYLWSWGRNNFGGLGLGDSGDDTNRNTPTQVGTKTWQLVAGGSTYSLAIRA